VTRRVSPPLVTSNTIFNVTRRGKTLLVMPNIHCVQHGNDTTHHSNSTSPPSPPSLEMRDGGGCISLYFLQPVPSSLKTQDGDNHRRHYPPLCWQQHDHMSPPSLARNVRRRGICHFIFLQPIPHPLPCSKSETEGVYFLQPVPTLA